MLSLPRTLFRCLRVRQCRLNHSAAGPQLNSVTPDDLAHFAKFLAPSSILSTLPPNSLAADEISQFNNDWMGKYHGHASTVLKPRSTQEVSEIVKRCWDRRIGIVPQGGNTGLVGGSVPVNDEVVLSLSNMNKVRSFDPVSGQLQPPLPTSLTHHVRHSRRGCRLRAGVSD